FDALEARIAGSSDGRHCFGDGVTIADVCLVPQVHNARAVGLDLGPYPTLARVAAPLETLDAFSRAAPRWVSNPFPPVSGSRARRGRRAVPSGRLAPRRALRGSRPAGPAAR